MKFMIRMGRAQHKLLDTPVLIGHDIFHTHHRAHHAGLLRRPQRRFVSALKREFFIDNLLVGIHLIIEMILVDRPCVM